MGLKNLKVASGLPHWLKRLVFRNKKRESHTVLLVPLVEAFALPESVERADMQRPHANMNINIIRARARRMYNKHIHKASTVAAILTDSEVCEVSTSQERALSKRFFNKIMIQPSPRSPNRVSAVQSVMQIYIKKF